MNKEQNSENPQNQQLNIADVICWLLFSAGCFEFLSYIIWALSKDTTDKWFTRLALSMMCFGFFGIIHRLRK
jgi:hypothetical protein